MKLLVVKPYIVFILFATVLNLAGCAILLNPKIDTQEITFEAEDGREYDFYVDNALVCPHTDKCVFVHNKRNNRPQARRSCLWDTVLWLLARTVDARQGDG